MSCEPPLPGTSADPGISFPLMFTGTKTSFSRRGEALESRTPKAAIMSEAELSALRGSVPPPSTRHLPGPEAASMGMSSLASRPDSPTFILSALIPRLAASMPLITSVAPPSSRMTSAPMAQAAEMADSESPQGLYPPSLEVP